MTEVSASEADGGSGRGVVTVDAAAGWTAGSVDVLGRGAASWNQQLNVIMNKQHYKCNAWHHQQNTDLQQPPGIRI